MPIKSKAQQHFSSANAQLDEPYTSGNRRCNIHVRRGFYPYGHSLRKHHASLTTTE